MLYLITHIETGMNFSDREDEKLLAFREIQDAEDFMFDNDIADVARYQEDFFLTDSSEGIFIVEYDRTN